MPQLDLNPDPLDPEAFLAHLDLAATPAGISRVGVRGRRAAPSAPSGRIGRLLEQAREEIGEYLTARRTFFEVPVDLGRIAGFERAALELTAAIPYGEFRTYQWIADRLGHPGAARAVGAAMARNPVPILVPCHRVVRTDGGLGGYACGLARKAQLLSLEGRNAAFVGSASTLTVCRRGCRAERAIPAGERVDFAAFADAAAKGCRPCRLCTPERPGTSITLCFDAGP